MTLVSDREHLHWRDEWPALLSILVLLLAVYSPALCFPVTDHDDLTLLLAVEREPQPWFALVGDWGMRNDRWRPLHTVPLWVSARLYGGWALPRQAMNLALHFANVALLYGLLRRAGRSRPAAYLIASIALVSLYVVSPTVWVSDRSTLWLSLSALLLLDRTWAAEWRLPLGWLTALSILALMAKESGLILPLFGLTLCVADWRKRQIGPALACLALICGYVVLRRALFPGASDQFAPHESGYLMGLWPYDALGVDGGILPALAALENVAKGVLGAFVPVFNRNGGFYHPIELLLLLPTWLPTLLLTIASLGRRRHVRLQRAALLIIALNALVHFALFRHRNMYLTQMMVVLLFGTNGYPVFGEDEAGITRWRQLAGILVAVLLLSNTVWVTREVAFQRQRRVDRLAAVPRNHPLLEEIVQRYSEPCQLVAPGLLGHPLGK